MATSRLDMRIDESLKTAAEKAAALQGMKSLTEYVVGLIENDARRVIKAHESIVVKDSVFDRFMSACEALQSPNRKLQDAAAYFKEQGIG